GTARVRQRSLQTTQSYRALLQQTQVLSQIRHALRKIQSLLQSPRRARLRVDAPETICRYGLERFRPGCLQLRWMSVISHPLRKERTKDGAPEVVLTLNSK